MGIGESRLMRLRVQWKERKEEEEEKMVKKKQRRRTRRRRRICIAEREKRRGIRHEGTKEEDEIKRRVRLEGDGMCTGRDNGKEGKKMAPKKERK